MRPLIFSAWKDPEDAHEFVMARLERAAGRRAMLKAISAVATIRDKRLERRFMGLRFPNPLGLAGGFDKNGRALRGWEALGFGFIEAGTVTWHPQPGNPRPRVFRYAKDEAIINRFGFNNDGAQVMADRLAADAAPRRAVLGISIGKSKVTPLDQAVDDYLSSLKALYRFGDYFAVNVSSPNTPGLRELQDKSALDELLAALDEEGKALQRRQGDGIGPSPADKNGEVEKVARTGDASSSKQKEKPVKASPTQSGERRLRKPILVKIAPDLETQALEELLEVCVRRNVDGLIATNTTLSRDGLDADTEEAGGLSGRPLFPRSLAMIRHIRRHLPDIPIIGVGGIMTPQDAAEMIQAGADLLQIYSSLIYNGPLFPRKINKYLAKHVIPPDELEQDDRWSENF